MGRGDGPEEGVRAWRGLVGAAGAQAVRGPGGTEGPSPARSTASTQSVALTRVDAYAPACLLQAGLCARNVHTTRLD
eukprot:3901700-Pleurochrysis_carterae.AAC.1